MYKPYILVFESDVTHNLCVERFECAVDMDDFVNSYTSIIKKIIFCGKIEREIKYSFKYARENVEEIKQ